MRADDEEQSKAANYRPPKEIRALLTSIDNQSLRVCLVCAQSFLSAARKRSPQKDEQKAWVEICAVAQGIPITRESDKRSTQSRPVDWARKKGDVFNRPDGHAIIRDKEVQWTTNGVTSEGTVVLVGCRSDEQSDQTVFVADQGGEMITMT